MESQTDTPKKGQGLSEQITIQSADLRKVRIRIRGTAPYVQSRFSEKAKHMLMDQHAKGSTAKNKKNRESKDFDKMFHDSMYESPEGWRGISAPSFRNAMISACRVAGFTMTRAKLSVFVEADGYDKDGTTPLVKITKGKPSQLVVPTRNATGVVDVRPRAKWDIGWEAVVTIKYDAHQFTSTDVANLVERAGMQVGVGEGRPDSKNSAGVGWGTFEIVKDGE